VTCRPFLGNDLVNTFPRQRICRQQPDNFRCYATRCKYNNRGRDVLYVVGIYPLMGNGCVFYGPPRDYISGTELNQMRMRENESGTSPRQSRKEGSPEDLF
jgi:hypothetical protein